MNILKGLRINGEIFDEYAFLSFEYVFENNGEAAMLGEYVFALPENSVISDMKLVSDGRIIRTSVTSASSVAELMGEASAVLRHGADGRCILSVKQSVGGKFKVIISVYTRLERTFDEQRLTVPLSKNTDFSAELMVNSDAEAVSPTHRLDINNGVISVSGAADRDFCLVLFNASMRNSAVAAQYDFGGELLCKVYPSPEFYKSAEKRFSKLLFIYDGTGSLMGGAARVARDAMLAVADYAGLDFAVVIAASEPYSATDGFCRYSKQSFINSISDVPSFGGSLSDALRFSEKYIEDGVLPILFCGKPIGNINFSMPGLCAITFGAEAVGGIADNCAHIFGNDDIIGRAKQIFKSFLLPRADAVEVLCDGATAAIVGNAKSVYDGVTVYAEYNGALPTELVLRSAEAEERFAIDNVKVYNSFAPLRLVRAAELSKAALKKLMHCEPSEVLAIRRFLEETGVKYSALNCETAFVINGGADAEFIRVIEEDVHVPDVFKDKASLFRERETITLKQRLALIEAATEYILKSQRADGAICACGELDNEIRKKQTLACLLALTAVNADGAVWGAAKDYLGGFEYNGMYITENADEAKAMIQRFSDIFADGVTDLLTAVGIIARLC